MSWGRKERYPIHVSDEAGLGRQTLEFGWEVFKVVVISLAIIIPVRYFLIKPFYVKGASMEPNFYDHEYLIIDELTYRFQPPQRGDIVVFRYPLDRSQFFIKRIVGLPQERVVIADGHVTIFRSGEPDGIQLEERYLPAGTPTGGQVEVELGEDEYYVLGDNRSSSLDSRAFGPIDRQAVVGRTLLRGWPIDRIELLNDQPYDF